MIARVRELSPMFADGVHSLKGLPGVLDIRNYGLAAALTLAPKKEDPTLRPYEIAMKCWEKGFYVRYGGDTIQLGIPFITTDGEVDSLINALGEAITETGGGS